MRIDVWHPAGPAELEGPWRELESDASASFFRGWSWTGCCFAERFPRPFCLRAELDGKLIALGLFNRHRGGLYLGETGMAARDSIYIEHNGLLTAPRGDAILADLLRRACQAGWLPKRLIMSGVTDEYRAAAIAMGGRVLARKSHIAPMLDLSARGTNWLAGLSANTRQGLRRSMRAYGDVSARRAETVAEAQSFLRALAALHQETWRRRGKAGAFANPFFTRFHLELIARALPREEIDLLRVTAGDAVIGYLYNFRYRGRVISYQGGFNYASSTGARKPGLSCHHAAIDMYAGMGIHTYDFLAGDERYKRSLSNAQATLHWLTIYPALSGLWRR